MNDAWFLLSYFAGMCAVGVVLFRAEARCRRAGDVAGKWQVVVLAAALVVLHWTWPWVML